MVRLFTSKKALFLIAPILLGACAQSAVGPGLDALRGKNVRTAITYLGYPDEKQQIMGDTVYTWSEKGAYTNTYPITDRNTGEFEIDGRRGTYEQTTRSYVSEFNSYSCKIKLATGADNVIKSAQASSREGGCNVYQNAFKSMLQDLGHDVSKY